MGKDNWDRDKSGHSFNDPYKRKNMHKTSSGKRSPGIGDLLFFMTKGLAGRYTKDKVGDYIEDKKREAIEKGELKTSKDLEDGKVSHGEAYVDDDGAIQFNEKKTKFSGFIDFFWMAFGLYIGFNWFLPPMVEGLRGSSAIGLGAMVMLICVFAGIIVSTIIRFTLAKFWRNIMPPKV